MRLSKHVLSNITANTYNVHPKKRHIGIAIFTKLSMFTEGRNGNVTYTSLCKDTVIYLSSIKWKYNSWWLRRNTIVYFTSNPYNICNECAPFLEFFALWQTNLYYLNGIKKTCLVGFGEMWMFVLLISVELMTITV